MALPHTKPAVTRNTESGAEAQLEAILAGSEDAILHLSLDGRILSWNGGAKTLFGYSEDEVVGQSVGMLEAPDLAAAQQAAWLRAAVGGSVPIHEAVRVRRDGERIVVRLTAFPVHDRAGALIGVTEIVRDITEQKKTAATASQLRLALDAAPNGIVMIDERGMIVMVNAEMERLFGYDRAEMLGQPIELLIPQPYWPAHPGQRAAYFHSPEVRAMGQGRNLYARRKDGTEFLVEVGLNPAQIDGGTFVLGAVTDITTRKKMEAELARVHSDLEEHAHKLEATVEERTSHLQQTIAELESVSYSLSHDLRGPLRTIQGFNQLVLDDAGDRLTADEKDLLTKAIRASHRLDRLIQDVLTYTRVSRQSVTLESVDVERLLRQIVDERPELRSPNAEIQIVGVLHPVRGHEASLTQVITNLLDNAVKFVPPERQPVIRVHSRIMGDLIELSFADNGIGIPREAQPRLFSIFQRVHDDKKYAGTGIGLAIVRKAVERMGGVVSLESEEGVGSRFAIQLPKGEPCHE